MNTYLLNKETSKVELHFSKSEYQALTDEQKRDLKSAYLFSGKIQAWVSRSTRNHYSAIRIAKKLGFTDGGVTGNRLSFAEEIERKIEKANARAERYEQYANNAEQRAEQLQSGLNKMHGDTAFFTQPNINSASGRSFTNYRQKLYDRYEKGFDEYRKSDYFKNKAITAEETANMSKFNDRVYLDNRIKECNSNIKKIEANIVWCEENNKEKSLQTYLERMEYEMDKLAHLENCLDEIGGIAYSKENIKEGYLVKMRGTWYKVIKANKMTLEGEVIEGGAKGMVLKYNYSEVQNIKIPEGYIEPTNEINNPYKVNDILVNYGVYGNRIIRAYQILKVTEKGVQVQRINIGADNKPIKNEFTLDKPMRKKIVKSKYSDFIGCYDGDWQLYKYNPVEHEQQLLS